MILHLAFPCLVQRYLWPWLPVPRRAALRAGAVGTHVCSLCLASFTLPCGREMQCVHVVHSHSLLVSLLHGVCPFSCGLEAARDDLVGQLLAHGRLLCVGSQLLGRRVCVHLTEVGDVISCVTSAPWYVEVATVLRGRGIAHYPSCATMTSVTEPVHDVHQHMGVPSGKILPQEHLRP